MNFCTIWVWIPFWRGYVNYNLTSCNFLNNVLERLEHSVKTGLFLYIAAYISIYFFKIFLQILFLFTKMCDKKRSWPFFYIFIFSLITFAQNLEKEKKLSCTSFHRILVNTCNYMFFPPDKLLTLCRH